MTTTDWGRGAAVAHDEPGHSAPNPTVTLPLKVEKLDMAGLPAHVTFIYRSTYDTLVQVDGVLTKITHGVGVCNLKVDRLWYAVPDGTLVTIETGEIR